MKSIEARARDNDFLHLEWIFRAHINSSSCDTKNVLSLQKLTRLCSSVSKSEPFHALFGLAVFLSLNFTFHN